MNNKESLNNSMHRRYVVVLSALVMATALLSGACKPWTHDAEWTNPQFRDTKDFHGTVVMNRGSTTLCKACHGSDLKGLGEIPGCYKCHFGPEGSRSPSGSSWNHGMAQHENLRSEEPRCNTCHELYRSIGLAPNTCHDCHSISSETHPLGQSWLDKKSPDFHGKSTLDCSTCHDLKTKCSTCHFGATGSQLPPGSGWSHGTTPHNQLAASEAVCNKCHTLDRSYGNGPATCHDCHGTPPSHVLGEPWLNQKSPQFHGKSTLNCASCHDLKTKCANCHFGATGSKSPSESGWTHGTTPHNQLESSGAVCNICHELDRGYGNGPATCHDCHVKPPHVLGQPWLDQKSSQFHGRSTLDCSSCHDLNTKCASCHFGASGSKSPSSGWLHGTTPHNQLASSEAVCNKCHKLDRSYGNGPATCHDCHSGVGGSGGGHVTGQPWFDPKSAQFHGNSSLNCSSCHDLSTKCSTCHFGASGNKSPNGSGWSHGTTPHNQLAASEAVCSKCHTLDRSYGNGPAACHDCHGTQSDHVTGQPWLDPKSAQFHGNSSLNCSSCHDLNTKCSTCHFGVSGSKIPSGQSWTHGTTPHNQLTSSEAVCNQCHTLERSYGNGPASCHDCHGIAAPHAVPFTAHGSNAKINLSYCQQCHAQPADGGPGSNPRFNVKIGSLSNGCESSGCHKASTSHPVSWLGPNSTSHQSAQNMAVTCTLCHGAELSGGSGPACSICHTAGSPLTQNNCMSCHATPPSGTMYPDTNGAHSVHNALAGITNACNTCHAGAGSQTALHYNNTVNIALTGYNAKTGTASYSSADQTCSNVSCHGGKKTPVWGTGTINVATECTACHASTGQYNSYVSGEHKKHFQDLKAACSECHDVNKLAPVHFNDLSSTAMTEAGQTIRTELNYNGSACLFTCHLDNKRHTASMSW